MLMTRIGEVVPYVPGRRPLGERLVEPEWYILRSPPMQEGRAKLMLDNLGVPDVWMPTTTAWRNQRGKLGKVPYPRRIAPGYLFVLFDRDPIWDRLKAMSCGRITGVVSVHGVPRVITDAEMWAMEQAPERIEDERRRRLEDAEMAEVLRRPAEGKAARLQEGPLAGWLVDVTEIHAGIARFLTREGGVPGTARVETLRREA